MTNHMMVRWFASCGVMGRVWWVREIGIVTVRRRTITPLCQKWYISNTNGTSGCFKTQFNGSLIIILRSNKTVIQEAFPIL